MEDGHQIRRNLTGDRSENARYLNSILAQVRDLQLTDKPLFDLVDFRVQEKGQNDRNRFDRFFGFQGPDDETMRLLEGHAHEWWSEPLRFWEYSSAGAMIQYLRPEAQILGTERAGPTPLEETVQAVHHCEGLQRTYEHAMTTFIAMIECGTFYKTLNTDIGGGACLVLGTSLPETHWTKLMTRKTKKRTLVLEHLTANTQVLEIAARFAAMQERIIEAKVESLLNEQAWIDGEGQGIPAFGTGLNVSDELLIDFTDPTFDGLWDMSAL